MTIIKEIFLSPQEYLTEERQRPEKFEYFNGKLIEMSGATEPHNVWCSNLHILIGSFLKKKVLESTTVICR